jgi:hypothetical protein
MLVTVLFNTIISKIRWRSLSLSQTIKQKKQVTFILEIDGKSVAFVFDAEKEKLYFQADRIVLSGEPIHSMLDIEKELEIRNYVAADI